MFGERFGKRKAQKTTKKIPICFCFLNFSFTFSSFLLFLLAYFFCFSLPCCPRNLTLPSFSEGFFCFVLDFQERPQPKTMGKQQQRLYFHWFWASFWEKVSEKLKNNHFPQKKSFIVFVFRFSCFFFSLFLLSFVKKRMKMTKA